MALPRPEWALAAAARGPPAARGRGTLVATPSPLALALPAAVALAATSAIGSLELAHLYTISTLNSSHTAGLPLPLDTVYSTVAESLKVLVRPSLSRGRVHSQGRLQLVIIS